MIRDNLKYILVTTAIIAAAMIISDRISASAVYIAETIKTSNTVELSENTIKTFVKELRSPSTRTKEKAKKDQPKPELKKLTGIKAGRYIKGKEDAPIEIIEFSDFECPFSKRHSDQTIKLIDENFIKTGKVKYSYRHLPLGFHANAKLAAAATECAGQQNMFWEMKDKLFAQESINAEVIENIAKELKLKQKRFNKCIKSEKTEKIIQEDIKTCQENDINGTPATLVNGTLVSGAYPYKFFEKLINEEN